MENMKIIVKYLICALAILSTVKTQEFDDTKCRILNGPPKKAEPSLLQCYRDNTEGCCNSLTDGYIKSQYNGMLSDSCARNFPVSLKS